MTACRLWVLRRLRFFHFHINLKYRLKHDMENKGIVARDCLPPEPRCPLSPGYIYRQQWRWCLGSGLYISAAVAAVAVVPRQRVIYISAAVAVVHRQRAAGSWAPAGDNPRQQSLSPPCRTSICSFLPIPSQPWLR